MSTFVKAETFPLGEQSCGWSELYIQDLIAQDPTLLGLGDLQVVDKERRHAGAGRLDFLLKDPLTRKRYAVEIQLGVTNESHIIRTIEYWDRERRRYPNIDHVAVIVAETINGRFFNVISLFNQHVPLIAIKMTAFRLEGSQSILFTRVLDIPSAAASEDEDEAKEPETSRGYWVQKASEEAMTLVDQIADVARSVIPEIVVKFNKGSVVFKRGTSFSRFMRLHPRKKLVHVTLPIQRTDETEQALDGAGIAHDDYDFEKQRYVITLNAGDFPGNVSLLRSLIEQASTSDDALDS